MAEIERSLGTPLLHRTTRKLSLTEDGAAFPERATLIVHDVEEAVADMAERRGRLSGPLRISAPVTFGRMHLGPALFPFLAHHPRLEMALELDDRRVDAASEGFDAVIRHGPILDSRLVVWRIAASQRVLVASPDYLARAGVPASIEHLRTHRGIFYTNQSRLAEGYRCGYAAGPRACCRCARGGPAALAKLRALADWLRTAFGDPPYWDR